MKMRKGCQEKKRKEEVRSKNGDFSTSFVRTNRVDHCLLLLLLLD